MIHKCICSQYSFKVPHPQKEKKLGQWATAKQDAHSNKPRPCPGAGGAGLGRPAPHGQMPGCGSIAGLAINDQVSANKVLKTSVPLPGEGRERVQEMLAVTQIHPEPVLDGRGSPPGREDSVTILSSSRPWTHPLGPGPLPGASLRSLTWSGRSHT